MEFDVIVKKMSIQNPGDNNSVLKSGNNLLQNGLVVLGLTGLVGGMVGALLSESIQSPESEAPNFFPEDIYKSTGVWFALAMLGIGAAMSVSQGIAERNPEKSTRAALLAVPASLIGGFFAGMIAQWVYGKMVTSDLPNEVPRSIGWAIAGGLGGAAIGLGFRSAIRVRNCLLGGLAGGFVGGLAFNTVAESVDSGVGSRFVGITLIGTLMGLAVGLIDKVTVAAHIEQVMVEGPPIRFSLFDQTTVLGCANNVGITVRGDAQVSEHHLRISRQGNSAVFECVGNASPAVVNGQPMTRGNLNNGDVFIVGKSQFRFVSSKARGGTGQPFPPAYAPSQGQPAQQQPAARQSVPMQPVTPRPAQQAPTQSNTPPASRPVIPIKKPD